VKLGVTNHAAERFQERVKPALGLIQARQELVALVEMTDAEIASEPPDWLRGFRPDSDGYIELSDGVVAGVMDGVIATILVRGGAPSSYRQQRNENRARRRARKRVERQVASFKGTGKEPRRSWA
jgi:hypothetical protein